ncbi:hypothetical protein OC842_007345 [Tilletia horrida]|uniref:Uncharacterized protein n=1 Tax=Tilletia horrida TaxID=155126 RepID=A0AAN6G8K6_9BASI|nr:hypothetical protein OC842_007345 [Tilletia horrida]
MSPRIVDLSSSSKLPEGHALSMVQAVHGANPFRLMALPGELLLHVLRFALIPEKRHQEDIKRFIRRGANLKLVCHKFDTAISTILHQHMHAFRLDEGLSAAAFPWHISGKFGRLFAQEIQGYWTSIHGSSWPRLPDLHAASKAVGFTKTPTIRTLSLDLRRQPTSFAHGEVAAPGGPVLGRTITTSILTRLLMAGPNLQELNLRISPDRDTVRIVEHLVCSTPGLRSLHLEVDCSGDAPPGRTVIKLQNMVEEGVTYSSLEHFVLRCPGARVECVNHPSGGPKFLDRLPYLKHFGLCATALDVDAEPLEWLAGILHHTPELRALQFAVDLLTIGSVSSDDECYGLIRLPHLTDLVIEETYADTSFLRSLDAPHLWAVRLRSRVKVETWPICRPNQFPALSMVNIWCPGVSAQRLTALGVPRWRFDYDPNLDGYHNDKHYHQQEFPAVIRPFNRPRPEPWKVSTITATMNERDTRGPAATTVATTQERDTQAPAAKRQRVTR